MPVLPKTPSHHFNSSRTLKTISSNGGNYTFSFFSPENSTNRYVGIWWKLQFTVIWVANRNQALRDSSGIVTISDDGNLVVLSGQKHVIWSSNVSNIASNFSAKLLDFGNLVLQENITGNTLWESFQHPSDSFLPRMQLTSNQTTGEKLKLTAWKSLFDPSIGSFSESVECPHLPEMFIWNETSPYWRSGPWNGRVFVGIPTMKNVYLGGLRVRDDEQETVDFCITKENEIGYFIYVLNSQGNIQENRWDT